MSAARVLETVQFIMPAIHVCVCDPGVGTARRPLAILTRRGDIIIGPDNGVLLPAVAVLGGAVEVRQISNPAVMRHPVSAVFHGRDVFCPAAAHLANGLRFARVGELVDPATLAPPPFTDAIHDDGRWLARSSTSTSSATPSSTSPRTSGARSPHQPAAWWRWCSREVDAWRLRITPPSVMCGLAPRCCWPRMTVVWPWRSIAGISPPPTRWSLAMRWWSSPQDHPGAAVDLDPFARWPRGPAAGASNRWRTCGRDSPAPTPGSMPSTAGGS
jgi:hypothetical protein